jgi:biotin carboxyl carrier protein
VRFEATVDGRSLAVEVRGSDGRYRVTVDGRPMEVDLQETGGAFVSLLIDGRSYEVGLAASGGGYTVVLHDDIVHVDLGVAVHAPGAAARRSASGPARLAAPMPGKIVRVLAEVGQQVSAGQGLVVMEAMKMENELASPRDGRVQELPVREGQAVESGTLLAVVG